MFQKISICSFLLVASTVANACPDLSGIYRNSDHPLDKGVFQFEQTECKNLKKSVGTLRSDNTIEFFSTQSFPLDGSSVCKGRICESVTATEQALVWKINFNGSVTIPPHGQCTHTGYSLSKTESGDLKGVFEVKNCSDNFKGTAEKTFSRL